MSSLAFDTIKIAKRLKSVGFTEAQSEELVEIYESIINENLATKEDIRRLELNFESKMKELELRMTIKLGTIMVLGIGIIATLVKVL